MTARRTLLAVLAPLFLCVFAGAAWATDSDSDGLSDSFESAFGTEPYDSDHDNDGLLDGQEVTETGTNPLDDDSDGDATLDGADSLPLDPGGTLDGGSNATLSTEPTSSDQARSGQTPFDGVGVNVVNGHLVYSLSVGGAKGVGLPFSFPLHYNSSWAYDGRCGYNWTGPFEATYSIDGGSGDVTIWKGDAVGPQTWTFTNPGYAKPGGELGEIEVESGDVTLTYPNGVEWFFAGGQLVSTGDRFGNAITYTRSSGKVTSITDSRGEAHSLSYYSTGRVQTLAMADGRAWQFRYNPLGQLMRIEGPATTQFPSGIELEFRYVNGSGVTSLNGNLIRAIDGNGSHWLRMTYDTSDRVATQNVGDGTFEFSYASPTAYKTTVIDRNDNERVWEWDSATLAKKSLTEKTNRGVRYGETDYTTTWTLDGDGYVTSVTYPEGNGVKYTLNAVKKPTAIRRKASMAAGDNDTNDIVDAYTYDTGKFYGVLTHTDPEGHVTAYTLNDEGQAETTTYPDVTHTSPDQEIETFATFNPDGTLESTTDGEGNVTTYVYFTAGASDPQEKFGRVKSVIVDDGGLDLTTEYDYDDWGNVVSVTDPRGNVTTMTVEAYGNVTQIESPSALAYVTKLTYDGNLNVIKKEVKNISETGSWRSTPYWWTTLYEYTLMDKLAGTSEQMTSGTYRNTTMAYDPNDNLITVIRSGRELENQYDERDLLYKRIRDPDTLAATEEFTYDGNRNTTHYKNVRAKVTTKLFDGFDRCTKVTNALGHYQMLEWDKRSQVTEVESWDATPSPDVLKAHHKTTYDELGRAWKEEDLHIENSNAWYARTTDFDKRGLVVKTIDRLSRETDFTYDGAGRLTLVEDDIGNTVAYELDDNGNCTKVTETELNPGSSAQAFETLFAFDALNRRTSQTVKDRTNGSNTNVTSWGLDCLNVPITTTDPKGNVVTGTFDGLGRMTQKSEDLGSSAAILTKWTYDVFANVVELEDDNGSETLYAFDNLNRLVTKTYENTQVVTYSYDDDSANVSEIEDQIGSLLAFGYDDLDRKIGCSITRGTGVLGDEEETWTYDALGRMTQAADDDSIVNFTYDSLSRVLTEQQGDNPLASSGKTVSYTWNTEGERTKVTYPSGFEARETRDGLGRLSEMKDQNDTSVAIFSQYGAGARLKTLTSGNGMVGMWGYDGFRRPVDISHKTSGSTERAGFEYGWDKNDNPTYEERRHLSGKGDVYTYDKANRLTKTLRDVDDPSDEVATPNSEAYVTKLEYDMDDVFNLTAYKTTPYGGSTTTTSYTTNVMNEYTAVGGVTHYYTDNGALKQDANFKYLYDAHDRLVKVTELDDDVVAEYAYDAVGLGRRTSKTVGSDVTRYVYAGLQSVEELDGSDALLRLFAFGDRIDQVVMMEAADDVADVDGDSNTTETMRFFFHAQLIGSVTHVTAAAETVVERYEYDPYGAITMKDQGEGSVSSSPIGNAYSYTGRQFDAETGLYYYRARQYSPALKRFVQRDPLEYGDGPNALTLVAARPLYATDPFGLEKKDLTPKGSPKPLSYEEHKKKSELQDAAESCKAAEEEVEATIAAAETGAARDEFEIEVLTNALEKGKMSATDQAATERALAAARSALARLKRRIRRLEEILDELLARTQALLEELQKYVHREDPYALLTEGSSNSTAFATTQGSGPTLGTAVGAGTFDGQGSGGQSAIANGQAVIGGSTSDPPVSTPIGMRGDFAVETTSLGNLAIALRPSKVARFMTGPSLPK